MTIDYLLEARSQVKYMEYEFHRLLTQYPNGLDGRGWNIEGLSMNEYLPYQYILNHPDEPWNWKKICRNIIIVDEFFELFWGRIRWKELSANESLTEDQIERHWDKLDIYALSNNSALIHSIISNHVVKEAYSDYRDIKKNTWRDVVVAGPIDFDKLICPATVYWSEFAWFYVINSEKISLQTIEEFSEIWGSGWFEEHCDRNGWYLVSSNDHLPIILEFVKKYENDLDLYALSNNYNLTADILELIIENDRDYCKYIFESVSKKLIYLEDAEEIIRRFGDKLDLEMYNNYQLLSSMNLDETICYIQEHNYNWLMWYQLCQSCKAEKRVTRRFFYVPGWSQLQVNWSEASICTDIDILEEFKDYWDYNILSKYAPVEFITAYPELPWDSKILSSRKYKPVNRKSIKPATK